MVLHREYRLRAVTQAFDGLVVEIDVRDLDIFRQRRRIDGKAVVLRCDLDLARLEIFDRVVRAAMTELQLEGLAAKRETENLVAEADAEKRHAGGDDGLRVVDGICQRRRIAGAIAEEHAVGIRGEDFGGGRPRRIYPDVATMSAQAAH